MIEHSASFASALMALWLLAGCSSYGGQPPGGDETQAEKAVKAGWDPRTQERSRRAETELDGWKPTCDEPYEPVEGIRQRDMDIVGSWAVRRGMDGSSLTIKRNGERGYIVSFSTSGCLDRWRLARHGEYRDGVLRLNRPVRDYFPLTYDRLYAIRIEGQDRLLIGVCPEDIATLSFSGKIESRLGQLFLMYKRAAASQAP